MQLTHLIPLLLLLGQARPGDQRPLREHLINGAFGASPEVALLIASSLLSEPLEPRYREELLRIVEGLPQRLSTLAPVDLIAGHYTDRPSGFLANATNLPITTADAHGLVAQHWLKSKPSFAREHVVAAVLLFNRNDDCASLLFPRAALIKRLLGETFKLEELGMSLFPPTGDGGLSVGVFAVADGMDTERLGVFLGEADAESPTRRRFSPALPLSVLTSPELDSARRWIAVRMFMAMCWGIARISVLASSEMMMRFKLRSPCSPYGPHPWRSRGRRQVLRTGCLRCA